MKMPSFLAPYLDGDSPTRLLQGLVVGALAAIVLGFSWGGWERGTTVDEKVSAASEAALVGALAPICAEKFQSAAKVDSDLVAELKAVSSWQRDGYLKQAGWATFAGGADPDIAVAEECGRLLTSALELDVG